MVHPNTFTFPHQWSALRLKYIKCHYRLYTCRSRAERRFWSSYIQNAHNIAQHQSVCHGFEVLRALFKSCIANSYTTYKHTTIQQIQYFRCNTYSIYNAFIHDVHDVICCKSMTCLWHSTQIFRIFGIFHVFEANKEDFLYADAEPPAKPKRCVL